MKSIYIHVGKYEKTAKDSTVFKRALQYYICDEQLLKQDESNSIKHSKISDVSDYVNSIKIEVDNNGKPYITDKNIEFSITHTGPVWGCAFSNNECGLDFQRVVDCNFLKIADRYFLQDEIKYIHDNIAQQKGLDAFFNVWVRKEAFGKAIGKGLFVDMPTMVELGVPRSGVFSWNSKLFSMEALEFKSDDFKADNSQTLILESGLNDFDLKGAVCESIPFSESEDEYVGKWHIVTGI